MRFIRSLQLVILLLLLPVLAWPQSTLTLQNAAISGTGSTFHILGQSFVNVSIIGASTPNRVITFKASQDTTVANASPISCTNNADLTTSTTATASTAYQTWSCRVAGQSIFITPITGGSSGTITVKATALSGVTWVPSTTGTGTLTPAGSTGAIQINGGSGALGAFGGITCTNKVLTALDSTGAAAGNCNTVLFNALDTTTWTDDVTLGADSSTLLPTEHAVKSYIDNVAATSISWKTAVIAASTGNLDLSTCCDNGKVQDGVTLATGNRFLAKDETAAATNGIYVVQASGALVRATDMDSSSEFNGATTSVIQGTANASTVWVQTAINPTVGITAINWARIAAGNIIGSGTNTHLPVFNSLGQLQDSNETDNGTLFTVGIAKACHITDINTSATLSGTECYVRVTTGNTNRTITLADASPLVGAELHVVKIDSGTGQLIIAPGAGNTLNNQASSIPSAGQNTSFDLKAKTATDWEVTVNVSIPNCPDAGGNRLNYVAGAATPFVCGTGGSASGNMAIGGAVLSGTPGSVLFVDGSGNLGQDNNHFSYDSSLLRLTLGVPPFAGLFSTPGIIYGGEGVGAGAAATIQTQTYFTIQSMQGTTTSPTANSVDDYLGSYQWWGTGSGTPPDTGDVAASIDAYVDASVGSGSVPGRIGFATTASGGFGPLERLRITSQGSSSVTSPNASSSVVMAGQTEIQGQLLLDGSTSGSTVLKAAAVAGTTTITLPGGTTNFSATGGASQVVKQTSVGGAFTVARLACADLSDASSGCSGSGTSFANPTATLGASAVNGSASTAMRSDAAPAINSAYTKRSFTFAFNGNGAALTTGNTLAFETPFACTISGYAISVTPADTATFKLWKKATGTAIPTVSDSINTSGVSISTGTHVRSTTTSDFTSTTVTANDIMIAQLSAVGGTATGATFQVECTLP